MNRICLFSLTRIRVSHIRARNQARFPHVNSDVTALGAGVVRAGFRTAHHHGLVWGDPGNDLYGRSRVCGVVWAGRERCEVWLKAQSFYFLLVVHIINCVFFPAEIFITFANCQLSNACPVPFTIPCWRHHSQVSMIRIYHVLPIAPCSGLVQRKALPPNLLQIGELQKFQFTNFLPKKNCVRHVKCNF